MHRIDSATVDEDLFGSGKDGFTEGDPGTGTPPTHLTHSWFNDVQEELCNFIESQGITLVKGTVTQLLAALRSPVGTTNIPAITGTGGPSGAYGLRGIGTTTFAGVRGEGGPTDGLGGSFLGGGTNGGGIVCTGEGTGIGVYGNGQGTGNGVYGSVSNANTSAAVKGECFGTGNGNGVEGTGKGAGAGIRADGGATGLGIDARGGATSGHAVSGIASAGNSYGGTFIGKGTLAGVKGTNSGGTGPGGEFQGGDTAAPGVKGIGSDTGAALLGQSNSTGPALELSNMGTSRAAVRWGTQGTPTATHVVGDMYVTTAGVLKICTSAGTPGTFVSVGAQT